MLAILLHACLDIVCDGLFKGKGKKNFNGREYGLLSHTSNKFEDLMKQCHEVSFVPARIPLHDGTNLHPEFLHYLACHLVGGVEGRDCRTLCQDAATAGFPNLESELRRYWQPESEDFMTKSDILVRHPNSFLSVLAHFRKFGLISPDSPIEGGRPLDFQMFWNLLKSQAKDLFHNDRAKLQKLFDDGVDAGYQVRVDQLLDYLKSI